MTKLTALVERPAFAAVVESLHAAGIHDFYASDSTGTTDVLVEWWGPADDVPGLKAAFGAALARVPDSTIWLQSAPVDEVLDLDAQAH